MVLRADRLAGWLRGALSLTETALCFVFAA